MDMTVNLLLLNTYTYQAVLRKWCKFRNIFTLCFLFLFELIIWGSHFVEEKENYKVDAFRTYLLIWTKIKFNANSYPETVYRHVLNSDWMLSTILNTFRTNVSVWKSEGPVKFLQHKYDILALESIFWMWAVSVSSHYSHTHTLRMPSSRFYVVLI